MGIFTLIAWGRVATGQERGPIRSTKTGSSSRPRPSTAGPERSPAGRRRPVEGGGSPFRGGHARRGDDLGGRDGASARATITCSLASGTQTRASRGTLVPGPGTEDSTRARTFG